jgi:hypothetical protein
MARTDEFALQLWQAWDDDSLVLVLYLLGLQDRSRRDEPQDHLECAWRAREALAGLDPEDAAETVRDVVTLGRTGWALREALAVAGALRPQGRALDDYCGVEPLPPPRLASSESARERAGEDVVDLIGFPFWGSSAVVVNCECA